MAEIGPTLRVDIGLKSLKPGFPPDLPMKAVHALIDTGAGVNAIDEELARQLGLPVTEEGVVSGVHGPEPTTFHTARVYIPPLDRLLFEPFAWARLEKGGQPHRMIFGRPFLRRYRMVYDAITGGVEIIEP